jgi:meiotic recombination protein SPO11
MVLAFCAPQDGIEAALADVTSSILSGEGFAYEVPSRGSGNQKYIPQLDRIVLLKDKARACMHAEGPQFRSAAVAVALPRNMCGASHLPTLFSRSASMPTATLLA